MDGIVTLLMLCGLLFVTGGTVGILRFPDFYTRLHPAGKLDTAGNLLIMAALALATGAPFAWPNLLAAAKILLIAVFVFITSPTATHAIVDAGVRAGLTPWIKDRKGTEDDLAA